MQKIILSDPKTGKSYSVELEADKAKISGKRIGNTVDGASFGLTGYKIQITGGSDKDGFPMRIDMPGRGRKKALLTDGPCYKPKSSGIKRRKTVRGNVLTNDIVQINAKIVKAGPKPIEKLLGAEAAPTEEAPAKEEKPKKKEKPKKEEKPAKKEKPAKEEKAEKKEKPAKKEKPVKEDKPDGEKKAEEKPPKKEKAAKKEEKKTEEAK